MLILTAVASLIIANPVTADDDSSTDYILQRYNTSLDHVVAHAPPPDGRGGATAEEVRDALAQSRWLQANEKHVKEFIDWLNANWGNFHSTSISPSPTAAQTANAAETYTISGKDVLLATARQSLARLMTLSAQKDKPEMFKQLRRLYSSLLQEKVVFTANPGTSIVVENYGADGIDTIRLDGVDQELYVADEDIKKNASK
jgi:hypothetical protein